MGECRGCIRALWPEGANGQDSPFLASLTLPGASIGGEDNGLLARDARSSVPSRVPRSPSCSRWPILAFTWPISVFTIGRFPNRRAASSASVSPRDDTEEAEATPRRESVDEHSRGVLFMSAAQLLLDQGAGISALSSARSSPS